MKCTLYAVPAMLCLTAAIVTAQAPAADKPAPDKPAAQQPATPSTPPAPAASAATNKITYTGCVKPGTGADASSVDLKPHANHKVEVTGTVSAAKPSADAPAAGAASAPRQQFSVDSVKMVSATCP